MSSGNGGPGRSFPLGCVLRSPEHRAGGRSRSRKAPDQASGEIREVVGQELIPPAARAACSWSSLPGPASPRTGPGSTHGKVEGMLLIGVVLAQMADLLVYTLAVDAGYVEGNPLMARLGPDLVVVIKLLALLVVVGLLPSLSPRHFRSVALVVIAFGVVGAASGIGVMA